VTLETPALSEPYEVRCFLYGYYWNPLFRERIASMVNDGLLKPMDVTLTAQTVWVVVHGLVALLIARPGYVLVDRQLLVDTVIDTVVRGLQRSVSKVK
jgi:hypothetical protein